MKINTNQWNRIRYTAYSFFYDQIVKVLNKERGRAIQVLAPNPSRSILIIGAGTGLDLPYLNDQYEIIATDITPAMLNRLNIKANQLNLDVNSFVMDGQNLSFEDASFDYVILNLILAVIPDPQRCLKETERVLKVNGEILVFDKFLGEDKKASIFRKIVNSFTSILFSDLNRKFSDILGSTNLKISTLEPSKLNGLFKIMVLRKDLLNK